MVYRRKKYTPYRKYKRSSWTRLQSGSEHKQWLKDHGKLYCHVCGWYDPLILPYFGIESHHIRQCRDGGTHEYSNKLACCPNCHRIADRISRANRDLRLTRELLIALIREHEFNRQRKIK
jgi:hypothetical protein